MGSRQAGSPHYVRIRRRASQALHARRRCSSANIHDTFASRQYIRWPRGAGRDCDRQGHRASLWPKSHFTTRCTRRPGANKFHDCPPRRPCGSGAGGRDDREASGEPYYASRPLARAVPSTDFRIPDDPQFRICGRLCVQGRRQPGVRRNRPGPWFCTRYRASARGPIQCYQQPKLEANSARK